jgi:hypothetical protein
MIFGKALLAGIACSAALLGPLGASALAPCTEPKTGTAEIPLFSPPLSEVVKGTEKLQLYSAPSWRCPKKGAFVNPDDKVIAHAQTTDGWTSVVYADPKTGENVSGWVISKRLKEIGTAGQGK